MHNLICDLWAIFALMQYALWEILLYSPSGVVINNIYYVGLKRHLARKN